MLRMCGEGLRQQASDHTILFACDNDWMYTTLSLCTYSVVALNVPLSVSQHRSLLITVLQKQN